MTNINDENINDENIDIDYGNKRYEQSGGFIDIIFWLLAPFIAAISFVCNLFINTWKVTFGTFFIPIHTELGETKIGPSPGQGYFWKYAWWCIKTGLYLVIFALGGIGFSLVGVLMIYKKLFSKFSTATKDDKDIPQEEKERIEKLEADTRASEEAE
jgi:hypothetical protein